MIWFNSTKPSIEATKALGAQTISEVLDIQVEAFGDDFIRGSMPVDHRTQQPFGLLHGGASVVLAETLGSIGSALCVDMQRYRVVGLDINANHIRGVSAGRVTAVASPLHLGRQTHVWSIRQVDEDDRLTCISRLTMAVIDALPAESS